ncbi:MAG TPA: AIPR family protein, partial [Phenylobacterium sp.]
MSQLNLNQIRARLTDRFEVRANALRLADAVSDPNRFLSRALAALALQRYADLSTEDAALSVTDHDDDGGIDAIHYSSDTATLYIVQSKWKNETGGGIALGDVLKYTAGIRNLLQSNSSYFGGPMLDRWVEIEDALVQLDKVLVIFAYSSETVLDEKQGEALDSVLAEFNQPTEIASLRVFSQLEIHNYLASGVEGDDINETIRLFQWGCLDQPHVAYYGQMVASDLAALAQKYGRRLFSSNIRQFLGKGGLVNQELMQTASARPDLFWYFNNGVTITARSVKKTALGGSRRDVADVVCEAFSIVNGAQTVGALSQIGGENSETLQRVMVPVRVISLETGGLALGVEITRATNTQNRVDGRNFVALNPLHQRVRRDLLMDGVTYVIQQTELDERGPKLFAV